MAEKLEIEGTENSEQLRNPKKATRHKASMTMPSKGVKHPQWREMRQRRISNEIDCLDGWKGGREALLHALDRQADLRDGKERGGGGTGGGTGAGYVSSVK
ncbi:UNVERIFIED_CONTAM: hypothetical protein FKN15_019562 [Acipenser sinensis]